MRTVRHVSLIASVAIFAGCGDATAPGNSNTLESVLREAFVSQAAQSVAAGMGGAVGFDASTASPACVFNSTSQFFECEAIESSADTVRRSYQLLNSAGQPLSTFDSRTVASVRTISDRTGWFLTGGGFSTPAATLTFASHVDHTLSGLLGATRTLNGTGNGTKTLTSPDTTTSHAFTYAITNVELEPLPSSLDDSYVWPKSGTVSVVLTAVGPGADAPAGTPAVSTVVTFTGTPTLMVATSTVGVTTTKTCVVSGTTHATFVSCEVP